MQAEQGPGRDAAAPSMRSVPKISFRCNGCSLFAKLHHLTQPAKTCTFLLLMERGGGSRETSA